MPVIPGLPVPHCRPCRKLQNLLEFRPDPVAWKQNLALHLCPVIPLYPVVVSPLQPEGLAENSRWLSKRRHWIFTHT
jgi:hypothetical protein